MTHQELLSPAWAVLDAAACVILALLCVAALRARDLALNFGQVLGLFAGCMYGLLHSSEVLSTLRTSVEDIGLSVGLAAFALGLTCKVVRHQHLSAKIAERRAQVQEM
jgi:inner membrane protein involved in colicin E2 resistance